MNSTYHVLIYINGGLGKANLLVGVTGNDVTVNIKCGTTINNSSMFT